MNFGHNYLIHDEFGEKEILCMCCGKTIKSRVVITTPSGNPIRELSKHADYKEIPVLLSDGNISFIMVCDDCRFVEIREEEANKITNQIKNAIKDQLIWSGKTEDLVHGILERLNRHVVRKAEIQEVAAAMKGVI